MNPRIALLAGGLLGATGVAAGAFGAHGLHASLVAAGTLDTWRTGAHYQIMHAVALLGLGAWMRADQAGGAPLRLGWVVWCWTGGVCCFSGSLYLLATGAPAWVGPITPVGGAALIVGWAGLIVAAWPKARRA